MSDKPVINSIGGQAIIEGVMMRGKDSYCLAVRNVNTKEISTHDEPLENNKPSFLKLPFIRGMVNFVDSMILGMKIITKSAEMSGLDEYTDDPQEMGKFDKWIEEKCGDKTSDYIVYFSVFLSMIISTCLFMILPVGISSVITKTFNISLWGIGIVEGIVKFSIFLGYILLISRLDDVNRLFKYHGAEHKTINCFESGEELTVENVRKHSRLHKRCGTSFIVILILITMIIFMFLQTDDVITRMISRVVLVPFIAGISYEVLRLAGKYDNKLIDLISMPGMAMQKITTQEPDDEMIETAIIALKGVLVEDDTK
ncbi:MAG: DUF1385 domain-containing protein [bacterium]